MMFRKLSSQGFTHILILVVGSIGAFGLIGYSGYRVAVYDKNSGKQDNSIGREDTAEAARLQNSEASAVNNNDFEEGAPVDTESYDLSTSIGTVNYVLQAFRQRDTAAIYSHTSPRALFTASGYLSGDSNRFPTFDDCSSSVACSIALGAGIDNIEDNSFYVRSNSDTSESITFAVGYKNGRWTNTATRYGGQFTVKLEMLSYENGNKWVIDYAVITAN